MGYSDKEIAERVQVMDVLEENQGELKQLMALRGIKDSDPGYAAFAANFARNKLRDLGMQNEFAASFSQQR